MFIGDFDEKFVGYHGLKAVADSLWWMGRTARDFILTKVSISEQSDGEVIHPTPQFSRTDIPRGEVLLMLTVTDSQNVNLRIVEFTSKKGNVARIDGVPEWVVDNPDKVALVPADDGMSCLCKMIGPLGTAKVSMIADADLSEEGVKKLVAEYDFEVVAGEAVRVQLEADAPVEQTDEE